MVVHCVQTNELPEAQAVGLGEQREGQKGGSGWTGNWNDGGVDVEQEGGLFCGFDARPGLDVGRYKATRLSRLN